MVLGQIPISISIAVNALMTFNNLPFWQYKIKKNHYKLTDNIYSCKFSNIKIWFNKCQLNYRTYHNNDTNWKSKYNMAQYTVWRREQLWMNMASIRVLLHVRLASFFVPIVKSTCYKSVSKGSYHGEFFHSYGKRSEKGSSYKRYRSVWT
jgi:hypothetical protein